VELVMSRTYALLDETGKCRNRIRWDGDASIWAPPAGWQAILDEDGIFRIYEEPQPPSVEDETTA